MFAWRVIRILWLLVTAPAGFAAEWWSLRPLVRPPVPAGPGGNAIDAFVDARRAAAGLARSPEADPRTLCRRMFFDLLGLPPTPGEVEAFGAAASDQGMDRAIEALADRLLVNPRHGERWARHWLDVVHYGETHGYDKDQPRPNAWPYRDYVVRAFNSDKPWPRFMQEQIAGDVLFPGSPDGVEALGFIAAGPWDLIGHTEVPETKIDGMIARHLDRDDMVANTISTFCSLTVHCAQCHDHKFDPIPQEEYYRLQAVFAALDRTDRRYHDDPALTRRRDELEGRHRALEARRVALESEARAAGGAELAEVEKRIAGVEKASRQGVNPRYGYHSAIEEKAEVSKWVQIDLGRAVAIARVVLAPCWDDFNGIGAGFGYPVRFRIEASDDPEFRGFRHVIAANDLVDGANPGTALQSFPGHGTSARHLRVTATRLAPRRADFIFALAELQVIDGAGANVAAGAGVTAADSIESPPRWARANLVDGIYPAAHGADAGSLAALRRELEELKDRRLSRGLRDRMRETAVALDAVKADLGKLPAPRIVYAGAIHHGEGAFRGTGATGGRPRSIPLLARGDVRKPGAEVGPGALSCVAGLPAHFDLPPDAPESARRAALARWLVDRRNPLPWRSIVNRVWHYHFGRGLVETPNDFGRMGASPTHPELLDWLAVSLRDDYGGSLRKLHRLIVTSATWRQKSDTADPAANESDGENRLLWRMNRRKLEAEALRDSVLAVAGRLDLTMGGPGFQDFVITHPEHSPHYEYHLVDADNPAFHRRSIYRFIVRSQQHPWMAAMDCADPSMMVDRRNETLTPLQALAQLNNDLMLAMADHFADRVVRQSAGTPAEEVTLAFRLALQRDPAPMESAAMAAFAARHGLANACRLIMNLNEFAFVD